MSTDPGARTALVTRSGAPAAPEGGREAASDSVSPHWMEDPQCTCPCYNCSLHGAFSKCGRWNIILPIAGVLAIIAAVLASCIWLCSSPPNPCPKGWIYYEKYCYHFGENEIDWNTAKVSCSEHQARLIVFDNLPEMEYIRMRASRGHHWIGLQLSPGEPMWINEDLLGKQFKINGGDGECGYVSDNEKELAISPSTCSLPRKYICKMAPYKGIVCGWL